MPAAIQPAISNVANLVMIKVVAGFGTEAIAALVLAMRINMFALLPGFGLGNASGAIVGQNLGAGKPERAIRSTWIASGMLEILLISFGAVLYVFAPWIVSHFNDNPEVVRIGSEGLRTIILGYPMLALISILLRAINGAGQTLMPAIILALVFFGVQIPLAIFLSKTSLQVNGVFVAILITYAVQIAFFLPYFLSGHWTKKKLHR